MKIDHVGIAVKSIDEAAKFYQESLGLTVTHREDVPTQKVKVAFLGSGDGGTEIELLEPTSDDGAVAKFLAARGPGMHHVAFHSSAIDADMERLKTAGKPPLDESARPGARGHRVCFLHPKHAHGVLVELVG
ncbi:MAG: methylmalonyl-CoA epimerase [Elusimicrobia bacterium]|nr:methylmalonyl-CoA epimerase [Elusimicrobiota bacterium]